MVSAVNDHDDARQACLRRRRVAPGARCDPPARGKGRRSATPAQALSDAAPNETNDNAAPESDAPAGTSQPPSGTIFRSRRQVVKTSSWALNGLFIIALGAVLHLARDLLVPLVLAAFLSLILAPIANFFCRLHIPKAVSAGLVAGALFSIIGVGLYVLAEPATKWIEEAPQMLSLIRPKLTELMEPAESVQRASEQVEQMASVEAGSQEPVEVVVREWSFGEFLLNNVWQIIYTVFFTFILVYFLLGWGGRVFERLVAPGSEPSANREAAAIGLRVQHQLSVYFITVTAINVGLGVISAGVFWLLEMPNPLLWGTMVAVLNFIPYVGAIICLIVLTLVALLSFDTLAQAVFVPLSFLLLTSIEGQIVTPTIVGTRVLLNPLIVFVGVALWTWLWGIPGALLTVPILMAVRILADQTPRLYRLSALLRS